MFRVGQKAAHFMSQNKVGTIISIEYKKSNISMIGGTYEKDKYAILRYEDGTTARIKTSDLFIIYD